VVSNEGLLDCRGLLLRTESEILDLVVRYATEHDSVRAVVMNGSRVNPKIPKDPLQDYDIVYFVRDVAEFRHDDGIPAYFGDIMIVQLPEEMVDPPAQGGDLYAYLMQFRDGTRIDHGILPIAGAKEHLSDSLTVLLLDKDGVVGELPPPTDDGYLVQAPTAKDFADCCNEFLWLNPYVAKALWRDQLPWAKYIMEGPLRHQLIRMIEWGLVLRRNAPTAFGKHGANLKGLLNLPEWRLFAETFADADHGKMWTALDRARELFRATAMVVADRLGFNYLYAEDQGVSDFVGRIRSLPKDASTL
jgi:aminoglycoside 6-adenylyltransferase